MSITAAAVSPSFSFFDGGAERIRGPVGGTFDADLVVTPDRGEDDDSYLEHTHCKGRKENDRKHPYWFL